jgi:tetratricopeptide (TPR) repeat protein
MGFYTAQKNWRRLEQYLTDGERGPGEDSLQVKRTLGRLADEHGQPERAVSFWQAVHEADHEDRDANDALGRLYPKVGKWHSMVDLLRQRLGRVDAEDRESHFALFDEIVRIYKEELAAPSKVIGTWQAVLEFDPGNRRALAALLAEYEEMNRWPDAVRVLQATIEATDDQAEKITLHRRIADLMMDTFSNAAEAIEHLEAILALDPSDAAANAALRETYETRRDWYRFATVREREIGLIEDPGARHAATLELASLASERVRQPEVPIRLWRSVLEIDGDQPEALAALEDLYERSKMWSELAEILDRRATSSSDDPDAALLERLAVLYGSRLEDEDRAEPWWRALLEVDPEHRKAQAEIKRRLLERSDWDGLEVFHRAAGTMEAWGRTLEGQAKSADATEDEVRLLRRAANVWREDIVDLRRAMRCYDRMLELVPDNLGVLAEAIEVYVGADAPKRLAAALEALAERSAEPSQRHDALRQLADVASRQLHDGLAGFEALATLIEEVPGALDDYVWLEELARGCGRVGQWAEIVEAHLGDMEEASTRVDLLERLGQAYRGSLADHDRAVDAYERILLETPGCPTTLSALEELRRSSADWVGLVRVLEQRLAATGDRGERRTLRLELADALKTHLDRAEEAGAILEDILRSDEEEGDAEDESALDVHDALVRIHLYTADAEALAGAVASRRDLLVTRGASKSLLADHEATLGMLAYGTRTDRWRLKTAIDHYEVALEHAPGHRLALARLKELLASEDYRRRAAEILERDAVSRGAKLSLGESLEVQVVCALDLDARDDALELLDRLAKLYRDELHRWDDAWSTLMRMVSLDPSREEAITDLEALTDELARWRQVAALYETLADEATDDTSRARWLAMTARTWHYRLGEMDVARRHYEAMAELRSTESEALDALEEIFRSSDHPEELLGVLERRLAGLVGIGQDDIRVQAILEVADLLQDRLRRIPEAIEHLLVARDLAPSSEMVHERLVALLGLTESWERLRDTLLPYMEEVSDDPGRLVVAQDRLAQISERRLGDTDGAIDLYGKILGEDDGNAAALTAVERMFDDPALSTRVAPILEPIYTRSGAWKRLIRVLEAQSDGEKQPADQVPWQERIAEIYEEKAQNPRMGFEHRALAFSLDPGRAASLVELERMTVELGNHEELMLLLAEHVDGVGPVDRKIALHRTVAALARDHVGDLALAERHLEAVLGLTEADDGALDDLIHVARQMRDDPRLVELLVAKADGTEDPGGARALLAEAGELAGRHEELLDRAIEIIERLHELDPTAPEPLNALESLYGRLESWEALADVLVRKLEHADDHGERAALGSSLATVQGERLGANREAIATWREVLGWNPGDRQALRALDGLLVQVEDWAGLKEVLVLLQTDSDELGWVQLQYRVAELDRDVDRLDRPSEAIAGYAALLDRRPDHEGGRGALREMIEAGHEADAAFHLLEPVLSASGDLELIWHLNEVMAAHQSDDDEVRFETFREMARVATEEMEAPGRAFDAWSRALEAAPHRVDAREALVGLADALGRFDDLVALLIVAAQGADDLELERVLLLEAGGLLEREVGDLDAAEAIYGRVVESHPDDLQALARLGDLYRGSGDLQSWVETLARRCAAEPDLERRTALLLRHAQAARDDLVDLDLATASYLEVLDTAGPREEAVEALWAILTGGERVAEIARRLRPIFETSETWDRLHAVLEMELEILEGQEERLVLMDRLADMNLDPLDRREEALIWLGRAAQLDPQNPDRIEAAIALATEIAAWGDLSTILLRTALAAETDERRIDLWLRAAQIALDVQDDQDEAERIFRLVLEVDETHEEALFRLDELVSQESRWEELEPVLLRQLDAAAYDEERATILIRLGGLYRDRLGRSQDARAVFEQVVALDDGHRPALEALEVLTRDARDHEALLGVLHRLAETAPEREERASILAEMASLAEREMGDETKAIGLWNGSLALDPDQPEALMELQRLAELQGDWEGVITAIEAEVRLGTADGERLLLVHKRAARIIRDELGDPFRAQTHWQGAREVEPRDRETLDALVDVHRDGANLEALAATMEAQVSSGNYLEAETSTIWRELAVLYTDRLVDPGRAIDAWQEVTQVEPSDEEAVTQLEKLYESEGRWSDAIHHYRDRLTVLEGEEKMATWLRIAEIYGQRLGDPEAARSTYGEILAAHPGHPDASAAMEKVLRDEGHHDALAALLLDRVEHLGDAQERHDALRDLATVYLEQLQQPSNAFMVLQKAAIERPQEAATRLELERLAAATGMWSDLVDTYDAVLEFVSGEAARDLTLRAAEVVEEHLDRKELAAGYYGRALGIDADHEGALRAMVRICADLERWADLVGLLDRLAMRTSDYREQVELLHRLAEIQENEVGDAEGAIATWYRILEGDPLYRQGIENLERLHGRLSQWEALIDVLERRTQIEPGEAMNIALRIGDVLGAELGRGDDAIERFEDVLSYEPGHEGALERLAAIHGEAGDWGALSAVYMRAYDTTRDGARRAELARKITLLQEEVFGDRDGVVAWCGRVLEVDPGDMETLAKLEALFREAQDWPEVIRILEQTRDHAPTEDERVGALLRTARLLRDQLGQIEKASAAYEAVLEVEPTRDEALQALEELYTQSANWKSVLEVIEKKAALTDDEETRIVLMRRQGQIADEKMHDVDRAAKQYERTLDSYPGHEGVLRSLLEIYERAGRHAEAVQVLEDTIATASNERAVAEIHLRLASIWREQLGNPDKTLLHLEAAVEAHPTHPEALWRLSAIYVSEGAWTQGLPLLDVLASSLGSDVDPSRRLEVHKRLARCAEGVLDHERALEEYRRAAELSGDDEEVLLGLGMASFRAGQYGESQQTLTTLLNQGSGRIDKETRLQIQIRLGECATQLGDLARASEHLSKVVEAQPENVEALAAVIDVLLGAGEWNEAIGYLERLAGLQREPIDRSDTWQRIGEIQRDELDDEAAAIGSYEAALGEGVYTRGPLLQLMQFYTRADRFEDAVQCVDQLLVIEEEPARRALFAMSAAVICRDQLEAPRKAAAYFDRVLDADPAKLEAFEALAAVLAELEDWEAQAKAYERMIERVEGEGTEADTLRFTLHRGLGAIHRTRRMSPEDALVHLEIAATIRPGDLGVRETLADLYEGSGDDLDRAAETHRALLALDPGRLESYHRLFGLWSKLEQGERAWCVAGLLVAMGEATTDEETTYERRLPKGLGRLPESPSDAWDDALVSPDASLAQVFGLLYETLAEELGGTRAEDLGLRRQDRLESSDRTLAATLIARVAEAFGLAMPEIYVDRSREGLRVLPLIPPALGISPSMMSGRAPREIIFHAARALWAFHPTRALAAVYDPEHLEAMLMAAMERVCDGAPPSLHPELDDGEVALIEGQVSSIGDALERALTPAAREQLASLLEPFASGQRTPDVGGWIAAEALARNHAALACCGDVAMAMNLVRDDDSGQLPLGRGDQLRHFVSFAVSPEHLELRARVQGNAPKEDDTSSAG